MEGPPGHLRSASLQGDHQQTKSQEPKEDTRGECESMAEDTLRRLTGLGNEAKDLERDHRQDARHQIQDQPPEKAGEKSCKKYKERCFIRFSISDLKIIIKHPPSLPLPAILLHKKPTERSRPLPRNREDQSRALDPLRGDLGHMPDHRSFGRIGIEFVGCAYLTCERNQLGAVLTGNGNGERGLSGKRPLAFGNRC